MPTSWLANVMVEAEMLTPEAVPVPVRLSVWGLLAALSVNTTEAVRVPAALGANATASVHCAEDAREAPQLLVKVKSAALEPVSWTLVKVKVALPSFVKVADRGELVEPTLWLAKLRVVELKEKLGVAVATSSVLPAPPPQDMDHKPTEMHVAAKMAAFSRRRRRNLASITNASMARVSPHCDGFVVVFPALAAPIRRAQLKVLVPIG